MNMDFYLLHSTFLLAIHLLFDLLKLKKYDKLKDQLQKS
jgi:hypothetical protein